MIKRVLLDSRANEKLDSCLKEGKSLSQLVSRSKVSDSGSVHAYLPTHISTDNAYDFESGGLFYDSEFKEPIEFDDPIDLMGEYLNHKYLDSEMVAIFEDHLARPNDALIKDIKNKICVDKEVYYYTDTLEINSLKKNISHINSFHHVFFVFRDDKESVLGKLKAMDDSLATSLTDVFVCVYDDESYLHWER